MWADVVFLEDGGWAEYLLGSILHESGSCLSSANLKAGCVPSETVDAEFTYVGKTNLVEKIKLNG